MKNSLALSVAALLACGISAQASVSVELGARGSVGTTTGAPTENVFAFNEQTHNLSGQPVDSAMGWRWDSSIANTPYRAVAQSFSTGAQSVIFDKFTLKIGGANISANLRDNVDATFTLSIYQVPGTSAYPTSTGAQLLSSQTGDFSGFGLGHTTASGNITNSSYSYITFDFDNVTLLANAVYMVVLSFDEAAIGNNIALATNSNQTTYTDGRGAINPDQAGWTGASDFYFYAQAAPIPEPGTTAFALAGIGGIVFSLLMRRSRKSGN